MAPRKSISSCKNRKIRGPSVFSDSEIEPRRNTASSSKRRLRLPRQHTSGGGGASSTSCSDDKISRRLRHQRHQTLLEWKTMGSQAAAAAAEPLLCLQLSDRRHLRGKSETVRIGGGGSDGRVRVYRDLQIDEALLISVK
ncbi:hypothetical protein SDJN03_06610, partial [Cucurbita argyrosperma subsp. sororia]